MVSLFAILLLFAFSFIHATDDFVLDDLKRYCLQVKENKQLTEEQYKRCLTFARDIELVPDVEYDIAKLDIFIKTRNENVLKVRTRTIKKALFFIALHESGYFKYRGGIHNKADVCYLQVNTDVWNYERRAAILLLTEYSDDDIYKDNIACIKTAMRILLYNFAVATKNKDTESNIKDLIKYYHAPFDRTRTNRYYRYVLNKAKEAIK